MSDVFAALRQEFDDHGTATFAIRVRPSASRTALKEQMTDGTIKIDLAAVPEDGKANAALIDFLADIFEVPRSNIEILTGQTGRRKMVRIRR